MIRTLSAADRRPYPDPPHPVPTTAPYNVAGYLNTESPLGAGSAVHPSVYDFGPDRRWHGFRFWMAMTPYDNTNDDYENPCILASHDGYDWRTPPGLTNPIYPMPAGGALFNSDTDLLHDPRTDELVMVYRTQDRDESQVWMYARSPDGVTWPSQARRFDLTRPGSPPTQQLLSPALVRMGDNDWRAFTIHREPTPMVLQVWTATSLEGTWTKQADLTGFSTLTGAGSNPWHVDVLHDGTAFRMLLDLGPNYLGKPDGLVVASSLDGVAWSVNNTPVITKSASGWDSIELYRSTFAPHENGTHFRVWYSAQGTVGAVWHTGYTELPRTLWPTV